MRSEANSPPVGAEPSESHLIAITTLATAFGVITLLAPLAVAWSYRRKPVVALIAMQDRRIAFHREALTALDSAIAAARAEGKIAEADRLEPSRAARQRELDQIVQGARFTPHS